MWLLPYGATLTHLFVPDKHGVKRDVVLGKLSALPVHTPALPYLGQHSCEDEGRRWSERREGDAE